MKIEFNLYYVEKRAYISYSSGPYMYIIQPYPYPYPILYILYFLLKFCEKKE